MLLDLSKRTGSIYTHALKRYSVAFQDQCPATPLLAADERDFDGELFLTVIYFSEDTKKKTSALMMEVGVTYKTISTIAPVWALNVLQNSAAVSQKLNDTMEHSVRKPLVK